MAVLLFYGQARGKVAISAGVMQLIVYWLLMLGCTGFWITFLRVGENLVHADWHIAYELNPEVIFTLRRDRHLDRVLARGLAADRAPDFWPTGTWRLFAWIGATFWMISGAATAALATHWLRLGPPQRGIFLVILLIPAVNCTAASVIGPGLTRLLELRDAAREARRLLCEQTDAAATEGAPDSTVRSEDLIDTVPIDARAMRSLQAQLPERRLRIVDGDRARRPWR